MSADEERKRRVERAYPARVLERPHRGRWLLLAHLRPRD